MASITVQRIAAPDARTVVDSDAVPKPVAIGRPSLVGSTRFVVPPAQRRNEATATELPQSQATVAIPASLEGTVRILPPERVVGTADRFTIMQQWEGTVASISKGRFTAIIRDLTDTSLPEEQATFSIDEVSEPDLYLVVPGAVFYWAIGQQTTPSGTRRTTSTVRFRRLPAWSRTDIQKIRHQANEYLKLLDQTS